eukprot:SAG31_NODE_4254_length_3414_cov_5.296833_4_plen_99_part_00
MVFCKDDAGSGQDQPSTVLTRKFRDLVPRESLGLPDDAVVASHSFREMGASIAMAAGYSDNKSRRHGLWKRLQTMLDHYVDDAFPYSRYLARIFDFLL